MLPAGRVAAHLRSALILTQYEFDRRGALGDMLSLIGPALTHCQAPVPVASP